MTNSEVENVQNRIGAPQAAFVEDVEEFMKQDNNSSVEEVLRRFEEQLQKFKFMEINLMTKKQRWKGQVPDIKSALDIVKFLKTKKDATEPTEMRFLLSNQLYGKAKIPPSDKVSLWLGANVMLEYDLDEADALLNKNYTAATTSLAQVDEDLGFIRDQTTTVEVNMARVYNWDVKRRQALKSSA